MRAVGGVIDERPKQAIVATPEISARAHVTRNERCSCSRSEGRTANAKPYWPATMIQRSGSPLTLLSTKNPSSSAFRPEIHTIHHSPSAQSATPRPANSSTAARQKSASLRVKR